MLIIVNFQATLDWLVVWWVTSEPRYVFLTLFWLKLELIQTYIVCIKLILAIKSKKEKIP